MLLLFHHDSAAQIGPGGFGAVMTVPTARVQQDGQLAIGFGYIPKPFALYSGPSYDNLAYFATLGFLPFLEVSLRGTHALKDSLNDIGDRMASARVQLFTENHGRPAVVVGLHDLIAIQGRKGYFTALYAVATKGLPMSRHLNAETTVGYGVDWIEARSHEFAGLFGGISLGYRRHLFIKGEYDTKRFNVGLGFEVKGILTANFVLLEGNKLAFGANLQKRL